MELNMAHQLLFCADYVNLFGKNMNSVSNNTIYQILARRLV